MRLYGVLRVGGAAVTDSHVSDHITIEPEPPAMGPFNQYFGGALGLDITPRGLRDQHRGGGPRQLHGGRVIPYLLAGVGTTTAETNDHKPKGADLQLRVGEPGLAAAVGAGLEYLVTRGVAVGAEVKYLYTHGLSLKLAGESRHEANLGPVFVSLGLRVYLWDF